MSHLLSAIGALLVLVGGFLLYAKNELLDGEALGERAAATLVDDVDLRVALAPKVTDGIGAAPGGGAADAQVAVALEDPRVATAFGDAAGAAAEAIAESGSAGVDLDLSQVAGAALAESGFAGIEPAAVVELGAAQEVLDALELADGAADLANPLLIGGLVLLVLAVALAPGLAAGVSRVGVALGLAATLGVAALLGARALVSEEYDDELTSSAVEAAWNGLLGDLLLWTGVAGGAAVVVAVFTSLARD